ncbi:hypothetical protein HN51_058769 [Arachis hypogaea]
MLLLIVYGLSPLLLLLSRHRLPFWTLLLLNHTLSLVLCLLLVAQPLIRLNKNKGEALEAGKSYYGRLLNYKKDGMPFWNLLTISPIKDEDGKVFKFIG